MIRKFQKRPKIVKAIQFDGSNFRECEKFLDGYFDNTLNYPNVNTLHGTVRVSENDWVIKGGPGDFWPCDPIVFENSYYEVVQKPDD